MKSSLENDRTYLNWYISRGIAYVISRDYRWFKDKYLPAVCRLEKAGLKKDHLLLSDCYYMIGDIHDFNRCPRAAIKAYQKSFEWYPQNAAALREMGVMYETIGYYKKAASLIKKAIRVDPNDDFAVADYNCLCSEGTPLYAKDDLYWQARERLAQDKPNLVLNLLASKRTVEARQIMACAYGMLNDPRSAIEQWRKIAKGNGCIQMWYTDWFYMADSVWENAAFWEIIAQCAKGNRFLHSVWPIFKELNESIAASINQTKNPKTHLILSNRYNLLLAQYHIARINHDAKLAQKLFKRYPNWPDIEELYRKLSC